MYFDALTLNNLINKTIEYGNIINITFYELKLSQVLSSPFSIYVVDKCYTLFHEMLYKNECIQISNDFRNYHAHPYNRCYSVRYNLLTPDGDTKTIDPGEISRIISCFLQFFPVSAYKRRLAERDGLLHIEEMVIPLYVRIILLCFDITVQSHRCLRLGR